MSTKRHVSHVCKETCDHRDMMVVTLPYFVGGLDDIWW